MRKPNGYGSIKRLSGNRRRPFVFVISQEGRQKPVEYFATQVDNGSTCQIYWVAFGA